MVEAMVLLYIVGLLAVICIFRRGLQIRRLWSIERSKSPNGTNSVVSVTLGGLAQSAVIQGQDNKNPVLLILHGGPGAAFPGVGSRGEVYTGFPMPTTSKLLDYFTVVYWDQRGSCKSFVHNMSKGSLSLDRLVADADELADWLMDTYHKSKIYVAGSSWGTLIGLRLAAKSPEKIHAYIAMEQILDWAESDRLAYEWVLEQATNSNNRKAKAQLENLGRPPYTKSIRQWSILRRWLNHFGGFNPKHIQAKRMSSAVWSVVTSPDYSWRDIARSVRGYFYSMGALFHDIGEVDLISEITEVQIPVYFFQGKLDKAIPGDTIERFVDSLTAPAGKFLIWLEKSAHFYSYEDSRLIEDWLINVLLP